MNSYRSKLAYLAVLTLLITLIPTQGVADIDVNPSKRRPSVRLEGARVTRSAPTSRDSEQPASSKGKRRPYVPPFICRVDAEVGNYGCRNVRRDPGEPDEAELTEGDILTAVREIGLPSLRVRIQPGDETLVNIPTIFSTRPQPFARNVDLLGFDVDLVAEPVTYRWVHGDGTTASTRRPGRPYPAMDVTHRYLEPAEGVDARVDVTYQVRYRVDGGAWQTIDQTLLATGPAASLDVKEAAPVLTHR